MVKGLIGPECSMAMSTGANRAWDLQNFHGHELNEASTKQRGASKVHICKIYG